ncbi:MAG: amino acid ABC transporter permease [Dongiaceae bacterium]
MEILFEIAVRYGGYIFGGIVLTLALAAGSMALSLVAGLVITLARISGVRILAGAARLYIDFIRGTPALLHLFLVYFGLPAIGIPIDPISAFILAFGLNGAAFMAEIYRSGINSVAGEQMDSAKALGMSYALGMRRVILPQAVYVILPPTANLGISTVKDTSLALVIAIPEIMYRTYNVISYTFESIALLFIAAAAYLVVTLPMSHLTAALEARSRGTRH